MIKEHVMSIAEKNESFILQMRYSQSIFSQSILFLYQIATMSKLVENSMQTDEMMGDS